MKKTRENKKNTRFTNLNSQRAITLIALVVTIVVLLILAGVSISLVLGENGIINKAKEAGDKYAEATKNEQSELNKVDEWLEENTGSIYKPMITKWNIEAGDEVVIVLYDPMNYDNPTENTTNITIDWGDGTKETYTSSNMQYDEYGYGYGYVTHTYQEANSETLIEILGECNTIDMSGNSQLISIEDWGYTGSLNYGFGYCHNLTTIASPRTNTFKNVTFFQGTFEGCTNLTSIPADLFENCTQVESFNQTFKECTSLTGNAIPLWERVEGGLDNGYVGIPDGHGCYYGCTQLTNYDNVPEYWKENVISPS